MDLRKFIHSTFSFLWDNKEGIKHALSIYDNETQELIDAYKYAFNKVVHHVDLKKLTYTDETGSTVTAGSVEILEYIY